MFLIGITVKAHECDFEYLCSYLLPFHFMYYYSLVCKTLITALDTETENTPTRNRIVISSPRFLREVHPAAVSYPFLPSYARTERRVCMHTETGYAYAVNTERIENENQ